jgi:peptide methionine sulfoxide reductase MsrA
MRHKAIYNTHPKVVQIDGETDAFDKDWNKVELDEAKVTEEVKRLEEAYNAKQYQRDRLKEYPDLQECIHAILDDDLTALQAKRKLVKDKFPKP